MLYPFLFTPAFRQCLWGGENLARFGKTIPTANTGESWEISVIEPYLPTVCNGKLTGVTLPELIAMHSLALIGKTIQPAEFPLLVKLIDAKLSLSLQVHPTTAMAGQLGDEPRSKAEAWYILSARPGSQIACGLKAGVDRKELERALQTDRVEKFFQYLPARPGDIFFIPPGCAHSLGAGIVATEIQQNADITYRLYDYQRKDEKGRSRPLQIEKALAAIDYNGQLPPCRANIIDQEQQNGFLRLTYDMYDYFNLQLLKITDCFADHTRQDFFIIYTVTAGHGVLIWQDGALPLATGDTVLIPAELGSVRLYAKSLSLHLLRATPVW